MKGNDSCFPQGHFCVRKCLEFILISVLLLLAPIFFLSCEWVGNLLMYNEPSLLTLGVFQYIFSVAKVIASVDSQIIANFISHFTSILNKNSIWNISNKRRKITLNIVKHKRMNGWQTYIEKIYGNSATYWNSVKHFPTYRTDGWIDVPKVYLYKWWVEICSF